MKRIHFALALLAASPGAALAQSVTLDLGGTGAFGPLTVTTDTTLPLPADGVIQATSVSVAAGATLRFQRNAHNTGVTIVSQGDVTIDGVIDVSGSAGTTAVGGAGGPGGGDGGGSFNTPGPLSSLAFFVGGQTVNQTPRGNGGGNGSWYNSPCNATALGGGGGGGGGMLVIYSNTRIRGVTATSKIRAGGGAASPLLPTGTGCNASNTFAATNGFDGGVRLVAPQLDIGSLDVTATTLYMNRLTQNGTPTFHNSAAVAQTPQLYSSVYAFSANPLTLSMVSVNGTMLPAGSESATVVLPVGTTAFDVVVHATGCNGALQMSLSGDGQAGFLSDGSGAACGNGQNFNNNTNVTTTFTCTPNGGASRARLFLSGVCIVP